MFVSYAIAVRAADHPVSPRAVLMCIAGLHALVLLAPPLVSTDVFSYQAYARMGSAVRRQPLRSRPVPQLRSTPCIRSSAPSGSTRRASTARCSRCSASCLAPASIAASARPRRSPRCRASGSSRWSGTRPGCRGQPGQGGRARRPRPAAGVCGVGGGHNDMLMLRWWSPGSAMLPQRETAVAGSLVTAAGVKLTGGLFLPFALAEPAVRVALPAPRGADRRGGGVVGVRRAGVRAVRRPRCA